MQEFSKKSRLVKASEYQRVFKSSKRFSDRYFLVLAHNNPGNPARLGLAISRKKLPTAVQRNRVKRLVRESFRCHRKELDGKDIVVLAQKGTLHGKNNELVNSLKELWKKIQKCENY